MSTKVFYIGQRQNWINVQASELNKSLEFWKCVGDRTTVFPIYWSKLKQNSVSQLAHTQFAFTQLTVGCTPNSHSNVQSSNCEILESGARI